jgi:GT2 family glycosyltransferase
VLANHPHEIVGIHDAKSLAEGYNRGFARAKGDIILFSHDDVDFLCPDIGSPLLAAMETQDLIGIAGTTHLEHAMWSFAGPPYIFGQVAYANPDGSFSVEVFATPKKIIGGIQAMDGAFLAAHRRVLDKVKFDAEHFTAFHLYDTDFTYSAHLAGLRLAVSCELPMIHLSRGKMDDTWRREAEIFGAKRAWRMPPYRRRRFQVCEIRVQTREEVLEVMTPNFGD